MDLRDLVLKAHAPNAAGRITGATFILQSVGGIGPPSGERLQAIGTVDAVCPYCRATLKKKPESKTKCRTCGNFIYVRTRPLDNQRISVTEDQIELIAEQWAIHNGTHAEFLAAQHTRDDERTRLAHALGREPSRDELKLSLLNNDLADYAANGDWGLYRCARLEMGNILRKASNWQAALATYLEVCYLDLNGPNNLGGCRDPELIRECPPFSPKAVGDGWVNTAVEVSVIANNGGFDLQQVENLFYPMAQQEHKKLGLPISPYVAWATIKTELVKIETECSSE
jgi:hypothetical protein